MRQYLNTLISSLKIDKSSGNPWKGAGQAKGFFDKLKVWRQNKNSLFDGTEQQALDNLKIK
jgi:hypothetical protein